MAAGAKPHDVFAALYEQNSLARLLLQGRILTQREIAPRRPAAVRPRSRRHDLTRRRRRADRHRRRHQSAARRGGRRSGAVVSSSSGRRKRRSACEAARRSTSTQIAEQFGGGGHRAASGVRYPRPAQRGRASGARSSARRDANDESSVKSLAAREPTTLGSRLSTLDSRPSTIVA